MRYEVVATTPKRYGVKDTLTDLWVSSLKLSYLRAESIATDKNRANAAMREAALPFIFDLGRALMAQGMSQEEAGRILRWGSHVFQGADLSKSPRSPVEGSRPA